MSYQRANRCTHSEHMYNRYRHTTATNSLTEADTIIIIILYMLALCGVQIGWLMQSAHSLCGLGGLKSSLNPGCELGRRRLLRAQDELVILRKWAGCSMD